MAFPFWICAFITSLKMCMAMPWSGPRQTNSVADALIAGNGWTPRPTVAPTLKNPTVAMVAEGLDRMRLLAERQDTQDYCGIFNGVDFETTLSCGTAKPSCVISNTFAGCCNNDDNCLIHTTCYDGLNPSSESNFGSSTGSKDAFAYTCFTNPVNSLCVTYYRTDLPTQITGYTCGPTRTEISGFSSPGTSSSFYPFSSAPAAASTSAPAFSASAAPVTSSSDDGTDPSEGAVAGYVIAAFSVAAAIVSIGIRLHYKSRRKAAKEEKKVEKPPAQSQESGYEKPELRGWPEIHEAGGTAITADRSCQVSNELEASLNAEYRSYAALKTDDPQLFHELPADEGPRPTSGHEGGTYPERKSDRGFLAKLEKKLHSSKGPSP